MEVLLEMVKGMGRLSRGSPNKKKNCRSLTSSLFRLTQTVCMVPRKWATAEVLEWRRQAFEKGEGTTHWPHEANRSCRARKTYNAPVLTESQKKVL
jgi:hypothetical protein